MSFYDEVAIVMNSEMDKEAKKIELLRCGLQLHEVALMLDTKAWQATSDFDFSRLTFGVEIECYNFTREDFICAAKTYSFLVFSEKYNHKYQSYFKIVSDSSVTGNNGQEIVSPALNGESGLECLKNICRTLERVNARVNKSCGMHVHIGASKMSDEHYCRLVRNYQRLESAIDTFMPPSRRADNNSYCHSLKSIDFSDCTTKAQIAAALHFNRYYKVNAEAYNRHQTIEFRQHSGTIEYEKISHWIRFLAKLVEYSYKYECTTCTRIEEIPFLTDDEKVFFINRRAVLTRI